MDPTTIVYVEDRAMETRRRNRERFRQYYDAHREEFKQKNKEAYARRKEAGFSEEEIAKRNDYNRRQYYIRKKNEVKKTLESLRETADPSRVAVLDELLAEDQYGDFTRETIDVIAFVVKKKDSSPSQANE